MKRKWLLGVFRYGSGLLIAFFIFWGFYGFVKNDNWLAVTSLATLVLALGTFLTIWQNQSLQKRERKERLLNEILDWKDIHKSSLEVNIPFIDMTRIRELEMQGFSTGLIEQMKEGVKKQIETYVAWQNLTSHAKAVAMNEYIKAIAKESFEKELLKEINSLGNVLVEFLFLEQRLDMGMDYDNAKSGFEGEYLEVVEKVEQQIKKSKDKDELYKRYAKDLATSVNELLKKIAEAISNL